MRTKWALLFVLATLAVAQAAGYAQAPAVPPREVDFLAVSGTGEVRVVPDRALVRLGVEARAPAAGDAIRQNNQTMGQVIEAIRKLGIPERNIQTSQFNVGRDYEPQAPNSTRPPRPIYVVSNIVSVRLEDPTRVGAVIDAATGAGANAVQGVSFFTERESEARQQALQNAMRDAQTKAETLARAAGVRLAGVESIVESGGAVPIPMAARYEAAAVAAPTPILSGENTIVANVSVRYRIAR